jgi:hypothetical protein
MAVIEDFDGPVIAFGNTSMFGGTVESEAPFIILITPADRMDVAKGATVIAHPLDGSSNVQVSIKGYANFIKKIDGKYLPDGLPTITVEDGIFFDTAESQYGEWIMRNSMEGIYNINFNNKKLIIGEQYTFTLQDTFYTAEYVERDWGEIFQENESFIAPGFIFELTDENSSTAMILDLSDTAYRSIVGDFLIGGITTDFSISGKY